MPSLYFEPNLIVSLCVEERSHPGLHYQSQRLVVRTASSSNSQAQLRFTIAVTIESLSMVRRPNA